VEDPVLTHEVNVDGTFNVLLAARDAGCRRVVYAASSSAYGGKAELPSRESATPAPMSPYAVHKLLGEYYCRAFTECYGLDTVSLRYFNVFGPRQDPKSTYAAAVPAFVTAVLNDRPPTVFGDGEQTRDFTYISNVVRANVLAAGADACGGAVVNIACGERISVNKILLRINELLGKQVTPVYAPDRAGDVKHSSADISRAREVIGYEPVVTFDDGLSRAINWYAEHLG
jgi:nucleoside-diphosphate-sugar epimerase